MNTNKKTARLAGLFYLLMAASGIYAEVFFRQKLFVSTDIAATASNILSNILLYRIGIVSDILMSLCYIITAMILYRLLASINKQMAAAMVIFAAAGTVLFMFNILNEIAPLYILNGSGFLSAFDSGQRQSLAMLAYNLYQHGYMIGQVFFALWVLPLGVLIYQSGFIPKVFGVLFVIETIFGLLAVLVHFLVPNGTMETVFLLPGAIAELTFMFWLLVRGIDESKLPAVRESNSSRGK